MLLSIYLSIYLSEVKVQSTKKAVDYWLHWSIRKNNLQIEVFRRKLAFKALFKEQCQHGSSHKEKMFKKLNTTLPRTRGPLWVTVWLRQKEKNKADLTSAKVWGRKPATSPGGTDYSDTFSHFPNGHIFLSQKQAIQAFHSDHKHALTISSLRSLKEQAQMFC